MTELCRWCKNLEREDCLFSKESFGPKEEYMARSRGCLGILEEIIQERQQNFRDLFTSVGGSLIKPDSNLSSVKFVATLPIIDEWTRFFDTGNTEKIKALDNGKITMIYPQEANTLYLKVYKDQVQAKITDIPRSMGWSVDDANQDLVYGFDKLPAEINRIKKILENLSDTHSRYNGVQLPIEQLRNHKAIKPAVVDW